MFPANTTGLATYRKTPASITGSALRDTGLVSDANLVEAIEIRRALASLGIVAFNLRNQDGSLFKRAESGERGIIITTTLHFSA